MATIIPIRHFDQEDKEDNPISPKSESKMDPENNPLHDRADSLSRQYANAPAQEILQAAIEKEFTGKIALVSSFGAESVVLLHLVAQINPDIPVIFLDTEKHFAQTLNYRKKLGNLFGLTNLREIHPEKTTMEEHDPNGNLWRSDPDQCCTIRKVDPLTHVLKEFDSWITGRKQFHGGGRLQLPVFDPAAPHIKVNPIVTWTPEDVATYMKTHNLPQHPLVEKGYPSIGCWPCTHPVADGGDVRDGRWRGAAKTECGIHDIKPTAKR